jgi:hypothetical protein
MLKLLFSVVLLIALVMSAGVYFGFDPAWLVLAILGFGIFMVGRIGGPALPPRGRQNHWGSGHGIYFDPDDVWVRGSDSSDTGATEDERAASERRTPSPS